MIRAGTLVTSVEIVSDLGTRRGPDAGLLLSTTEGFRMSKFLKNALFGVIGVLGVSAVQAAPISSWSTQLPHWFHEPKLK